MLVKVALRHSARLDSVAQTRSPMELTRAYRVDAMKRLAGHIALLAGHRERRPWLGMLPTQCTMTVSCRPRDAGTEWVMCRQPPTDLQLPDREALMCLGTEARSSAFELVGMFALTSFLGSL